MIQNNFKECLDDAKKRYNKLSIMEKVLETKDNKIDKNELISKNSMNEEFKEMYELSLDTQITLKTEFLHTQLTNDQYTDKLTTIKAEKIKITQFCEIVEELLIIVPNIKDDYLIQSIKYKQTMIERIFKITPKITFIEYIITKNVSWNCFYISLRYSLRGKEFEKPFNVSELLQNFKK